MQSDYENEGDDFANSLLRNCQDATSTVVSSALKSPPNWLGATIAKIPASR